MRTSLIGRRPLAMVVVATLLLVGCSGDDPEAPATATPSEPRDVEAPADEGPPGDNGDDDPATPVAAPRTEPTPRASPALPQSREGAPAWGIAGLVPPNFPEPQPDAPEPADEDWATLYRALPDLGGWVGTFASWSDEHGMPEIMRTLRAAAMAFEFGTVPSIGFSRQDGGVYESTVDFADPAQVAAYRDAVVELAADVRPVFLGVGHEVNLLWEENPAAFEAFAAELPALADAVREASPGTQVFTTFQLEFLRGGAAVAGVEREPRWDLAADLVGAVDFVAFTSYPWLNYETPDEVPADYYRSILDHIDGPVGFTEIGWPAGDDSSLAPEGSPDEQARFIERLGELLDGVDPALVLWVHAYDQPSVSPSFSTLGLHTTDGTPRPALSAWQQLITEGP